ncbi:tetratricopeptide repeat protein [Treponema sp.]|uniref:tetratricopeptide repeat protein n=1 Tax=Treponema sp. TaxID=166 RepID=UPI00257BB5F4|nr:tetratricopeptide repeat protein [Treponema sp.]MBE6354577.1 tetratricopeptide repeat protein [Treponema sp.]
MESVKKTFRFIIASVLIFTCTAAAFSQELDARGRSYVQGLESYRNGDWTGASLFLRQAVASPVYSTADSWYILILSEMYAENYTGVVNDADYFLSTFEDSGLCPYVSYQKGRALHYLGQNDDAVIVLSDYCHQNPGDAMYPSALFWLGECFYDDYNFETARALYEKVVADFPENEKSPDAQFKLDLIAQREREQKLLYLLKMTGEEYLSSREEYEKQLREYQTEDLVSLRRQLNAANQRIKELEAGAAKAQVPSASNGVSDEEMAALKAKARQIQALLDEKNGGM